MHFRKDINSLRAIAIVSVVIFHFCPSVLSGGFVGVDLFFVISGFLMTGIILRRVESNTFDLLQFYKNRAKRIVPALAFLCLILLVLGWFILAPMEYWNLAKHVAGSLLFISNHVYLSEAGYFDVAAKEKWLLHTWSLSVEWQFYILYPVIVLLLRRYIAYVSFKYALLALTIIFYFFSLYSTYTWGEASYYLLPMRSWEMMLGGVAYIYKLNLGDGSKKRIELLGFILIVASLLVINTKTAWPGYAALFPAIGAYLIILSNRDKNIFSNNIIVQYVGKWSYSIYLWHWPVVAFIFYEHFQSKEVILLGIAISFFFGFLSYTFIESRKISPLFIGVPLLLSLILISTHGFLYQVPKNIYFASLIDPSAPEYGGYTWHLHKQFKTGFVDGKPNMLIIGDSQAGDFTNILQLTGILNKYEVRSSLISSKCRIFYVAPDLRDKYFKITDDIKNGYVSDKLCIQQWDKYYSNDILPDADVIFIAMNLRNYSYKYVKTSIESIRNRNKKAKIFIVGAKALDVNVPREMYISYKNNIPLDQDIYKKVPARIFTSMDLMKKEVEKIDGVQYIDIRVALCSDIKKKCVGAIDGFPVFYDEAHTTKEGDEFLRKYVEGILKKNDLM